MSPENGYLKGKDKDDCDRYVKELVNSVLNTRAFNQNDEKAIREAVKEMIDLKLKNHASQCAKERIKGGHKTLNMIISIISLIVSFGVLALALYRVLPLE
ncbi:MAG: hypothetical protein ACOC5T_00985 [Elusimicrobiota bacterium]